jgi:hypothetical protein
MLPPILPCFHPSSVWTWIASIDIIDVQWAIHIFFFSINMFFFLTLQLDFFCYSFIDVYHFFHREVKTTTKKLVFICVKFRLTKLTTTWTWGKAPPSLLLYTMCLATWPAPKWHDLGLPSGSPKIPKVRTPPTLGAHTFVFKPPLKCSLKQSCGLRQEFSNGMLHATYTQGNRGDFQLLVVENQIANLIPGLSFGHNLCLECPNGSCKPTIDMYFPRFFQWYNEHFNPMNFDPYNYFLKIRKFIRTPTPKMRTHLGMWVFILSHSPTLPRAWTVTLELPSSPHLYKPLP